MTHSRATALSVLIVLAFSTPALGQDIASMTGSGAFACQSPEVVRKLLQQRADGDVAGFAQTFTAALAIRECVKLRPKEQVTVTEKGETITQVLRSGSAQRYYTFTINLAEAPASTPVVSGPKGAVQFCKETDLVEPAQTKLTRADIRLPNFLILDDFGEIDNPASSYENKWALTIMTVKPLRIAPGARCAVIPAVISPLSQVRTVSPKDHRDLEITAVGTAIGEVTTNVNLPPSWDWTPNIHAQVAQEFK